MQTPEYKLWLSRLRVGDTVCWFSNGWPSRGYEMATINRVTATQAICLGKRGEFRFRLDDGKVIGQSYRHVKMVTDAVRKVNREAALEQWFGNLQHQKSVPLHVIEAMKAAHDKAIKEAPTS